MKQAMILAPRRHAAGVALGLNVEPQSLLSAGGCDVKKYLRGNLDPFVELCALLAVLDGLKKGLAKVFLRTQVTFRQVRCFVTSSDKEIRVDL